MKKNDVLIIYGNKPKDMVIQLCEAASLELLIGDKDKKIGLKPNLVLADKAENGATTHPEIAEGVIQYLQSKGYYNISVIEGSWIGGKTSMAFEVCGFNKLAEKYNIKNIDTQKDTYTEHDCKGMKIKICDSAMSVDFMINMPVLKGHCQTRVTCALKNNKGVIPNSEKRHFHTMGLHKPIAHLNAVAKNDFVIVDGICGDLTFEEGGNPVQMNRLIATMDPVLCDAYVCGLLGYKIEDVPYIKIAESLGIGNADLRKSERIELNDDRGHFEHDTSNRRIQSLTKNVRSKDACSACYGSLIHALERIRERRIHMTDKQICIGQGFQKETGEIGIGSCTCDFRKSLKGCPPKAIDIIQFLTELP